MNKPSFYTLENKNQMKITLTNVGPSLVSIVLPAKNKKMTDVCLGYKTPEDYLDNNLCLGATIGRYANRISNASFTLNGIQYKLLANDGKNSLHSGLTSENFRIWQTKSLPSYNSVSFEMQSPHLDQGFPGNATLSVKYTLDDLNRIIIEYHAVSDMDTYFNFTNHSYFNLDGHDGGNVLSHYLKLDCDSFTPMDSESIPTGEIRDVSGTPMDFRTQKRIGQDIDSDYEQIKLGMGYDHNYNINHPQLDIPFAIARSEKTDIVLKAYTDLPGVQFYTGNYLGKDKPGKDEVIYPVRGGFCLETQFFPDSPNKPNFPSNLFKAGEEYKATTVFEFSLSE